MSRLIVNADDFGLTAGVNRAIVELHRAGVLTSATLMARAAATDEAIEMAKATPTLGVGCHVVLVDGEPVLWARGEIPWLANPITGRFRATLGSFLSGLYREWPSKTIAREIEAEAAAQIASLARRGMRLTHVDTHKHTHMFPTVLRPVLRAARTAGIGAVRNPFEPAWSRRATTGAPWVRRAQVAMLRRLETTFLRIVAEEGFATTCGSIGVLATGTLDSATLTSLLAAMPEGTFELVSHPGYNDGDLAKAHTQLLAQRETEREALGTLRGYAAAELISFGGLRTAAVTETKV